MKKLISAIPILLFLVACNASSSSSSDTVQAPVYSAKTLVPGTVILSDSMLIPDPLNKLYFSVKLVSNEFTTQGTYDVQMDYAHNTAAVQITFPRKGTQEIIPKMKKGTRPFSYIIGFNYGVDDPTFYDYYLIEANAGKIETRYLKAYSFK